LMRAHYTSHAPSPALRTSWTADSAGPFGAPFFHMRQVGVSQLKVSSAALRHSTAGLPRSSRALRVRGSRVPRRNRTVFCPPLVIAHVGLSFASRWFTSRQTSPTESSVFCRSWLGASLTQFRSKQLHTQVNRTGRHKMRVVSS
jgi:hypothetical protein